VERVLRANFRFIKEYFLPQLLDFESFDGDLFSTNFHSNLSPARTKLTQIHKASSQEILKEEINRKTMTLLYHNSLLALSRLISKLEQIYQIEFFVVFDGL
jgi:hypothetical protein